MIRSLQMMFLKLSLRYSFYQPYWKTRFNILRSIFNIRNEVFKGRTSLFNSIQDARIFWSLFKTVFLSLIIALLSVVTINFLIPITIQVNKENISTFDNLMIVITGVTGVFLGFYMSNLNTVIGNSYAKLPNRIRQLIIDEKAGNLSLRFVVFLNTLALLTLSIAIIWNIRSILSVYFLSVLSAFSIFVMSFLLRRIFLFIDPTSFINFLISDFWKWFNFSTNRGFLWKDPSFQNHYHSQASKTMKDLRVLFDLALNSPELQSESLHTVIIYLNVLHENYAKKKALLPTDSRWFSLLPKHKDWYLADSHELNLATNTRILLQPSLKPDIDWVEKILLQTNYDALSASNINNKEDLNSTIFEGINDVILIYGQNWFAKQANEIIEQVKSIAIKQINSSDEDQYLEQKILFVDYLGSYPITMFLGFSKKISTINIEHLFTEIENMDWINPGRIYNLGLPYPVLERLEYIQKRLEFERKTEGHIVSSAWYITLLISQSLAFSVEIQLKVFFSLLENHYIQLAKLLIQKEQFILSIQILSRGLEFTNKITYHLGNVQRTTDSFSKYKFVKTLPWPAIDWEEYRKELIGQNNELLFLLSQCIPKYPKKLFSEDFPDYLGLAVHTSGEALFDALDNNNHTLFEKIFPNYFLGILEIHDRLLNRNPLWTPREKLAALSEPFLDLIDLSGYAYIYSEYHQNSMFWKACKDLWDRFLSSVDTERILNQFASEIYHSKHLFAITARSLTRTNWEIRLNGSLSKFPRKIKWVHSFHALNILEHPSRLIRVLGGTDDFRFNYYHAADIFIDLYLKTFPKVDGLDFGNRTDLRDALHRWEQNEQPIQDDGETSEDASDD